MPRLPIYFPLSIPIVVIFFLLLLFLFAFIQVGLIGIALEKLGISPFMALMTLFLSIWGSMINIPVKVFEEKEVVTGEVVTFFGMRYVIPVVKGRRTVLAVNVGGAVVPVLISLYLILRSGLGFGMIVATAVVTLVVHRLARPIKGVGIGMPAFIPPVLAAVLAMVLAPDNSPAVAYVSGTMGTLIGADLMNIKKIRGLGAPVASIGGAGTFDGIFFTGVLAVLLA